MDENSRTCSGMISFDLYQRDMKESAERSSDIISSQRDEINKLRRSIATLILAAGGEIKVSPSDFVKTPDLELMVLYSPDSMYTIFQVKESLNG